MDRIKNIIFDLGGVLLDVDYQKSIDAFKALGIENFEEMFSQFKADDLFEKLETGKLEEAAFYQEIQQRSPALISNGAIKNAWNAMILNFRKDSLQMLEKISSRYRLYLLSNTNAIHMEYFQKKFTEETGKPLLDQYFIKAWYSHKLGLRKPWAAIYEFVLLDENLNPKDTLFIDDSINNIEAAATLGINTRLLKSDERIENYLL